jgi:hypothetical protein
MNVKLKQNRQMRSVGIAFATSILAAVATMFVPVSVLESITGASGLSELVPITAAPLGDTARALIAFAAGALTLSLMVVILLRQNTNEAQQLTEAKAPAGTAGDEERDPVAAFKNILTSMPLPKMPWAKGADDITDLSDLPKLRGGDSHPDAPPRRPLSATHDLPVFNLTEMAVDTVTEGQVTEDPVPEVAAEVIPMPAAETEPVVVEAPIAEVAPEPAPADPQPTLADMVAQLEASVALRQQQLAELEIVAANLAASRILEQEAPAEPEFAEPFINMAEAEVSAEPVRPVWPPLEAVPASATKADDMDEALAAALATLHRMNGTGR